MNIKFRELYHSNSQPQPIDPPKSTTGTSFDRSRGGGPLNPPEGDFLNDRQNESSCDNYLMLYNGQKIKTPEYIIHIARELRQNITDSEKYLWSSLKNKQVNGYRFRCQHPIYRYIMDFYCHETMLAIELDGDAHKNRKDYDAYRDDFLQSIGIKTLRFSNKEVRDNVLQVVHVIGMELINRTQS